MKVLAALLICLCGGTSVKAGCCNAYSFASQAFAYSPAYPVAFPAYALAQPYIPPPVTIAQPPPVFALSPQCYAPILAVSPPCYVPAFAVSPPCYIQPVPPTFAIGSYGIGAGIGTCGYGHRIRP